MGVPPGFPPLDPAALRLQQQMALQQQACSLSGMENSLFQLSFLEYFAAAGTP